MTVGKKKKFMCSMNKVLFLSNDSEGLFNFRQEVIQRLLAEGYRVIVSTPFGERVEELKALGCEYKEISLNRHGTNPLQELKLIADYNKLLAEVRPDIVFTYTIKPNIYGGLVCAHRHIPYIANITGLGISIENNGLMQKLTLFLYRWGLKRAETVFFQNAGNLSFMRERRVIRGKYDILPGSGVNLQKNPFELYPEDNGTETFLFVGRLMKDKGIEELTQAAKRLRERHDNIRFIAVGPCETDYQAKLQMLDAKRAVTFAGEQKNVHEWMKNATAIVHPSYHEGMSNVCLEAAACGRPVLASDVPGCRETFDEGVSGFGFKPRDVDSLCEAIEKFIALPYEKKAKMGRAGRQKVEREFDRQIVVEKYLAEVEKR